VNAQENPGRLLVIFDGQCVLCNRTVRWLLRRDRRDRLRFAASESPAVSGLLARHGFAEFDSEAGPTTILVLRDPDGPKEQLLAGSDAVVAILRELPGPWPAVAAILGWVPRPVRDFGYRLVARWRYRIWGRLAVCPTPTADERARFL
jgi:predicted DCC family thiol-disulfide oxidoreductase YuxK